ncbi:uncharacterized protein K452DRAFT_305919 [Aplosporella prunicola CBS 121167]|uniref:Uncharacterized protein n=1 Tax=Aplosporella prunicola CBS 121167 TaxID=1176127 RepID=A0A6A6BLH9_9PEZI|nr:uncharacterized protein K452DRAFT_305919 [Aplosporella prunicola CBS 121167]KAF2144969.1 hypothetical protein K452DRAFT_305919 [Aplosporella prunicola CBS 121167]
MSGPQVAQASPRNPVDSRRKRKAKDASAGKHEAKRIRTQEEEAVANGTPTVNETALVVGGQNAVAKVGGDESKQVKKKSRGKKDTWYTSDPAGGRFLHIEPVFSRDERYLIFSTARAVHIYSTATSLLVRTLPSNTSHPISAYALSSANPDNIYVSDASGFVVLWDWVNGRKLGRWDLASRIQGMTTALFEEENGTKVDTLYTHERGQSNTISAHRLRGRSEGKDSEAVVLLKTKLAIQSFSVAADGHVIAVAFTDRVMIGKAKETSMTELKNFTFVWREIKCTETVTAIDVRVGRPDVKKDTKKTPRKGAAPSANATNLTIGCANGAVFVYEDILLKLIQAENPKKESQPVSLAPRLFHWHRNAVATTKWSLDGNYVLSGGLESVLVIWQMETGKRQYLPHLSAAIDNLKISPSGSLYAVQLADNSVIVLSTTDLEAKANIAGVQSQVLSLGSTNTPEERLLDEVQRTPAAINPLRSSQVLLAVPASQPKTDASIIHLPAPFLQTYDISANHHVFRQAITRNNATIFAQGPNAARLREPDVKHLQVSHDGRWLATVEEWAPPADDVEHLAAEKLMIEEEKRARREIYLKFWLWNEQTEQWMLETRIDAPHQFADKLVSGRVFDLKYDPTDASFTTVGEDGYVRIWAPKTRLHDGTVVRGSKGEGLITWANRHSVRLEASLESLESTEASPAQAPIHARLAYSPDGSVLAASQEFHGNASQGLVHFINPASGTIRYSRGGLYNTGLVDLGFIGRQFIILANSLSVWDLVDDELSFGYSIRPLNLNRAQKAEMAHLAINPTDNTFAVALPVTELDTKKSAEKPNTRRQSKIVVFGASSPKPLYTQQINCLVTALLPAQGGKGYVALNTTAEIRVIAPKTSYELQLIAPIAQAEQNLAEIQDEETALEPIGDEGEDEEEDSRSAVPLAEEVEYLEDEQGAQGDKPLVRPEQLANVFDVGPSFALPPVRDLFEAVVHLYARKPRVATAA